jgi:type II secretory pathway component PulF
MATFRYQALDQQQRWIAGELTAESVTEAIAALEARGLSVQSIAREGIVAASAAESPPAQPAPVDEALERAQTERAVEQVLQKAFEQRDRLLPALRAYKQELAEGNSRRQLEQVVGLLEAGDVSKAVPSFSSQADAWLPLVASLSQPRATGGFLDRFVQRVGQVREIDRSWWLVLSYPVTLLGLFLGVLILLSQLLIPAFHAVMAFQLPLPLSTRSMLLVADLLRSRETLVLAALLAGAGLIATIVLQWNPQLGRDPMRRLTSRLPSSLTPRRARAAAMGSLALQTADSLESGLASAEALRVAGLVAYRQELQQNAWRLSRALEQSPQVEANVPALSATLQYALRADLPSAAQVNLCREVGECYLEQTSRRSWTWGDTIGPLGVLIAGLLVLWLVLALFQPMFGLVNALSG